MFTSWQTSIIGVAALGIGSALFYQKVITWDQFLLFLGIFGIGVAAKDHNVTGGTKE